MTEALNYFEKFISGGVGGVCTVIVGHPLDTIKVILFFNSSQSSQSIK